MLHVEGAESWWEQTVDNWLLMLYCCMLKCCLRDLGYCHSYLHIHWKMSHVIISVTNGSKFPVQFWVRFHPEPDCGKELYHTKNPDHCYWASLQPKSPYFNLTTSVPIKYLSSDCIVTWLICRLSSFIRPFISSSHICDPTIISWVAIKNPQISYEMW